jgi:hypothetical protein
MSSTGQVIDLHIARDQILFKKKQCRAAKTAVLLTRTSLKVQAPPKHSTLYLSMLLAFSRHPQVFKMMCISDA